MGKKAEKAMYQENARKVKPCQERDNVQKETYGLIIGHRTYTVKKKSLKLFVKFMDLLNKLLGPTIYFRRARALHTMRCCAAVFAAKAV